MDTLGVLITRWGFNTLGGYYKKVHPINMLLEVVDTMIV